MTYHILGSDTVWALTDSGYQELSYYSPGYPNTPEGLEAYRTASMALDGAIVINEIVADAKSGLRDEDGENVDWIELYNTTDRTVSLDNYALSNKENQPLRWRFPEGAVIAPHGYYLVFCSGKDRREDPTAIPHVSFRIYSTRDLLLITDQGFGKKTTLTEYRLQGRNGYGVKAIAMSKERGALVGALVLDDDDQIMAIMKSGKVIRFDVSEINRTGRSTQGVTIAKPDDDDQIVEITLAEKKPQMNKQ